MHTDPRDRREFYRFPASGEAVVICDRDRTVSEIAGRLVDVSCGGVALVVPTRLEVGAHVSLVLINPLDGSEVRLEGCVRHVQPVDDGQYRLGFCLSARLNPQDVVAFSLTALASLVRSEFLFPPTGATLVGR